MKINRLLELIYILMHRKHIRASELAEQLGVSRRTIYRDIETLCAAGIPIYSGKGKSGGIGLLPNAVLTKAILSEREQDEILTALHGLSNMNIAETNDILQRLSMIFNKTAANWLRVDFSEWGGTNSYFYDFKTAILENRFAEFDYFDSKGDKTRRRAEPLQLWFKSKAWYLKAYCLEKQSIRVFKLSRIRNLFVTNEHYVARNLPDIQDISTEININACDDDDNTIKLRIESAMKYRIVEDFDVDEIEEQHDGSYIVTLPWKQGDWVHGFVLSYGEHAEVLQPEHLRKAIMDAVQKIHKKYF